MAEGGIEYFQDEEKLFCRKGSMPPLDFRQSILGKSQEAGQPDLRPMVLLAQPANLTELGRLGLVPATEAIEIQAED